MKANLLRPNTTAISAEIANLTNLDIGTLRERWRELYGHYPPGRLARTLLVGATAYGLQERAFGGIKSATRRLLTSVAEDRRKRDASGRCELRPGTLLFREWHGVNHRVTVLERGMLYQERRYRSLSEVARAITGNRWSGPLFFGLKKSARG